MCAKQCIDEGIAAGIMESRSHVVLDVFKKL
jgi:hypothetical protein